MNYKTKRHYKKLARTYLTLAWIMMLIWMAYIVTSFIMICTHIKQPPIITGNSFIIFLIVLFPIIVAVILGYIGQGYINTRKRYQKQINEYRQKRYFTNAITLLRNGKTSEAIYIYIYDVLLTDHTFRKFIYPFIICENLHAIEDDRRELANKRLNSILNDYNPDSIIFV